MVNEVYIVMRCNLVEGKNKREPVCVLKNRELAIEQVKQANMAEIWSDCCWHHYIEKKYFFNGEGINDETEA